VSSAFEEGAFRSVRIGGNQPGMPRAARSEPFSPDSSSARGAPGHHHLKFDAKIGPAARSWGRLLQPTLIPGYTTW
jgi:hypothetical protein